MADLYEVLGVSPSATEKEIKQAYRRRSLETHPDRFPAGSKEQEEATVLFQDVNSAYYVLSDSRRRDEYDTQRASGHEGYGFPKESGEKADAQFNKEFKSTFEQMMGEEGAKQGQYTCGLWATLGALAGIALGFIIFNFPGAAIGAVAGFTIGRVRDVRKKAVFEVFQELPHAEKAKLLSGMLTKVMTQIG